MIHSTLPGLLHRRLERLEPLAALALGLHGAAMLLLLGGETVQWLAVGGAILLGLLGLLRRRFSSRIVYLRLAALVAAAWLLMVTTGGTGSFFLLWYFVLVPVYALLLAPRAVLVLLGVASVSYLLLLGAPASELPVFVVVARTSLLVFIGWIVQAQGAAMRREAKRRESAEQTLRVGEERFSLALDATATGVWDWDIEQGSVYWSDQVEGILRLPEGLFEGTYEAYLDLVHPEDRAMIQEKIGRALATGENYKIEHRVIGCDGAVTWIEGQGRVFFDADGKPVRMVGIVADITERKQVQQALQASEELNRRILESVPGGVVRVSAEGAVRYGNAEALRVLGMSYDALTDAYVSEFETRTIWEDGSPCPVEEYPVTKCLQTGEAQPGATIGVCHPDGGVTWAVFTAVPVHDPQTGALEGAVVTFLDVTRSKRIEEALKKNEARLAEAQRLAHLGNWERNLETEQLYWSDELFRIYGLDPETHIPSYELFLECVHPEDRAMVEEFTRRAIDKLEGLTLELRAVRPDGTVRRVWSEAQFPARAEGEPQRMVGTVLDITERKEAEEAARRAQQALLDRQRAQQERVEAELEKVKDTLVRQTRLATIGQLAASVAHELRNPLGAVRNAAYYLQQRHPEDPTKRSEYLGIIEQEVKVSEQIIKDLLEMSRSRDLVLEVADLAAVVQEVYGRLEGRDQTQLHCRFVPQAFYLRIDVGQFRQVLLNLFANALQALNGPGHIVVEASRNGRYDTIIVRDDGPGIPDEVRAQVFEPLFTLKAKGTGLGLSICRQIVERHGGTIDLLDVDGPGAAFRIRLPGFREQNGPRIEP